jgi:hypothetical protein
VDRRSFLKSALAGALVLSARQKRGIKDELIGLGEELHDGVEPHPDDGVLGAVRETLRDHVSAYILPPVKMKKDLPKRSEFGAICFVEKDMSMYSCLGGKPRDRKSVGET